jgi:carbon-monoxide dehydrogenase medium subunit
VIPDNFEYVAPATVREAITLLREHADDGKVLAGGQSLIPLMKFRLATPAYLIDLRKVPGLNALEERDGILAIGAMVREAAIEHSPVIQRRYAGLAEASSMVADPIVRNFATLGGNLAHADPANDHPAMMLALRASLVADGPNGRRTIPVDDFFVDALETSLAPDEVLVEIQVPRPGQHSASAYEKLERKVGDYAIVGVAASLTLDGETCTAAGLGLTNVGSTPIRPREAEAALVGKRLDDATIREAARLAAEACEPSDDLRGPAEYKRAMVRTLTARALRRAQQRALVGGAQ